MNINSILYSFDLPCHLLFTISYYRRVYSSLSFITPVIIFTLVYNIPKFFELEVVTRYPDRLVNNTFSNCAKDLINSIQSRAALYMESFFEKNGSDFTSTKHQLWSTAQAASLQNDSNRKIFFSVEQLYNKVLEECCNCTSRSVNTSRTHSKRSTYNIKCNKLSICEMFITQLITFLQNFDETNHTEFDDLVRVHVR